MPFYYPQKLLKVFANYETQLKELITFVSLSEFEDSNYRSEVKTALQSNLKKLKDIQNQKLFHSVQKTWTDWGSVEEFVTDVIKPIYELTSPPLFKKSSNIRYHKSFALEFKWLQIKKNFLQDLLKLPSVIAFKENDQKDENDHKEENVTLEVLKEKALFLLKGKDIGTQKYPDGVPLSTEEECLLEYALQYVKKQTSSQKEAFLTLEEELSNLLTSANQSQKTALKAKLSKLFSYRALDSYALSMIENISKLPGIPKINKENMGEHERKQFEGFTQVSVISPVDNQNNVPNEIPNEAKMILSKSKRSIVLQKDQRNSDKYIAFWNGYCWDKEKREWKAGVVRQPIYAFYLKDLTIPNEMSNDSELIRQIGMRFHITHSAIEPSIRECVLQYVIRHQKYLELQGNDYEFMIYSISYIAILRDLDYTNILKYVTDIKSLALHDFFDKHHAVIKEILEELGVVNEREQQYYEESLYSSDNYDCYPINITKLNRMIHDAKAVLLENKVEESARADSVIMPESIALTEQITMPVPERKVLPTEENNATQPQEDNATPSQEDNVSLSQEDNTTPLTVIPDSPSVPIAQNSYDRQIQEIGQKKEKAKQELEEKKSTALKVFKNIQTKINSYKTTSIMSYFSEQQEDYNAFIAYVNTELKRIEGGFVYNNSKTSEAFILEFNNIIQAKGMILSFNLYSEEDKNKLHHLINPYITACEQYYCQESQRSDGIFDKNISELRRLANAQANASAAAVSALVAATAAASSAVLALEKEVVIREAAATARKLANEEAVEIAKKETAKKLAEEAVETVRKREKEKEEKEEARKLEESKNEAATKKIKAVRNQAKSILGKDDIASQFPNCVEVPPIEIRQLSWYLFNSRLISLEGAIKLNQLSEEKSSESIELQKLRNAINEYHKTKSIWKKIVKTSTRTIKDFELLLTIAHESGKTSIDTSDIDMCLIARSQRNRRSLSFFQAVKKEDCKTHTELFLHKITQKSR